MFYYFETEVRIGDIIATGNRKLAIVEKIIEAESQEAADYACTQGGILVKEDWEGRENYLFIPKYSAEWEDMKLVRRSGETRIRGQDRMPFV
jgi:hypothetical protein